MGKNKGILSSQDGFVLVFGLMIMAMLTIIGIGITSNTIFELKVSGNDKVATELFYSSEGAALEAAQRLENEKVSDNLKAARTAHLWLLTGPAKDVLLTKDSEWDDSVLDSGMTESETEVRLAAFDMGVVKGEKAGSLKMTESRLYLFGVIGHSEKNNGEKMIEIGYRKRY